MVNGFSFIHVGKCGGSSIVKCLRSKDVQFEHIHVTKPLLSKGPQKYIFLVRDPVERFISCLNWAYFLNSRQDVDSIDDSLLKLHFTTQLEFLSHFANTEDLATELQASSISDIRSIVRLLMLVGHVPYGFKYYYEDLLDNFGDNQLLGVICTENLNTDFKYLFDFECQLTEHMHYEKRFGKPLSKSKAIFMDFLQEEYRIIEKLQYLALEKGVLFSGRY